MFYVTSRFAQQHRLGWLAKVSALVMAVWVLAGCESTYLSAMEQIGIPKREILVDRVSSARTASEEAKDQFASALEHFQHVVGADGGELEARYDELASTLKVSESKAERVTDRIEAVESVSKALFREWEAELDAYTSPRLRAASEDQMLQTRARYDQLIGAMRRAERQIEPVLGAFRDQVLFLKHNLNARAIAALQTELGDIRSRTEVLIKEMEEAIRQSDKFIDQMGEV